MAKVKVGPDVEKDLVVLDLEVRDAAIWTMRAMTAKSSLGHRSSTFPSSSVL
jgi:hypothetical protein